MQLRLVGISLLSALESSTTDPAKCLLRDSNLDEFVDVVSEGQVPPATVLVTGGGGFIGSHLVDALLSRGISVRVLDNFETGSIQFLDVSNPNLHLFIGSIDDIDFVTEAMEGVEGVFHLAAASKVAPSLTDPSMATFNVHTNALGTANLLEAAAKSGTVKRFIYAASSTYYGNQNVPFSEFDRFVPSSPYAASKYMGELLTATYDKVFNLPCVNLRFFMVYGPRQPSSGAYAIVTGKFAAQASLGLPLTIEGSGDQYRDFIHVKDIVDGILRAYHSDVRGVTINLGTGEKHSIKQVADLISEKQVHVPPRPHDLRGTLANTTLAEDLLGFIPSRNFSVEVKSLLQSDVRTHLDPFWNLGEVLDRLDELIPGFSTHSMQEQDTLIRAFGIEQLLGALFE